MVRGGGAGDDCLLRALIPPNTPPITAAASITPSVNPARTQKYCRLSPQILCFLEGGGSLPGPGAIPDRSLNLLLTPPGEVGPIVVPLKMVL